MLVIGFIFKYVLNLAHIEEYYRILLQIKSCQKGIQSPILYI